MWGGGGGGCWLCACCLALCIGCVRGSCMCLNLYVVVFLFPNLLNAKDYQGG